jgi:hypothetical protein
MLYYVNDPSLRAARNAAGEDYTPAYIPAMLAFMGMTGREIAPDELPTLTADDVVLVGSSELPMTDATVILMGTQPTALARKRQIYGYYTAQNGYAVPLFVPVCASDVTPDEVLAYAEVEGEKCPALVRCGKNYQYLFDLPATLWYSGDGFMEMQNDPYFVIGRTPDWRPLPGGQYGTQPFNDLLLLELEGILRSLGIASLYRLPPMEDGAAPDIVLHFSGDDDCCSATINANAAARMKQLGLPYHINAMPNGNGEFCFDMDVLRGLQKNGCELGLHLDLTCQPYSEETVKKQFTEFCAAFGMHPVTNVNHCLVQNGPQAEFLRWLQGCGIIADNGYLGTFDPNDINAFDLQEFGYGTSFPRYTCDDAAHGNALLTTMAIPLTYYEARLPHEDSDTTKLRGYLDGAAANARITQLFFHPHYLNESSDHYLAAQRALSVMKEHIAERGYVALPMTTNTIAQFWKARSEATVTQDGATITVKTDAPMLVRLCAPAEHVTLDGQPVSVICKSIEGTTAYLVAVPAGEHVIG